MGLTASGLWKSLFCPRTSPVPSPLFSSEPTSSPSAVCPGGEHKSSFFLFFSPIFPGAMPLGWLGQVGKGHPRARRNPGAAGWAGAGSAPPCALIFPYLHGKVQIHGDPPSPRGHTWTSAWGWAFSGHPKISSRICACASEGIPRPHPHTQTEDQDVERVLT